MKGGSIALSAQEVRKGLYLASKSVTLATTTLVEPTGAGRNIRDGIGNMVSSIIDQVYVQDLTWYGFVPGTLRHQRTGRQGRQSLDQRRQGAYRLERSDLRRGQDQRL